MDKTPVELTAILAEIERALEAKLYYLALSVALSLPDICACLEFDPTQNKVGNVKTYSQWCDANMGNRFVNITGADLWYLRCGVVHAANFEHKKNRFDRIMFIGPGTSFDVHDLIMTVNPDTVFGGIKMGDARVAGQILVMDIVKFCNAIMDASRQWSISRADDPNVQGNLPYLIRYRPNGLPPFSIGLPTIA
jgi:hypothetical protein